MEGRAEYEKLGGKNLFEKCSPSSLFPWVLKEGYGRGMIIAKRGHGKTFYLRKLREEIPLNIYQLDKKTLEYELYEESANPKAIILDDGHYLFQRMRLGYLRNNPIVTEEFVLGILENANDEAKNADAKFIFVADEGVTGLSYSFDKEKNKKKFLSLLRGCVSTYDDIDLFRRYLGKYFTMGENVLNFREIITHNLAVEMKKEFKLKDVPITVPRYYNYTLLRPVYWSYMPERRSLRILVSKENEPDKGIDTTGHTEWSLPDKPYGFNDSDKNPRLLMNPREMKVLSEEFGRVSRKVLGINFGEEIIIDLEVPKPHKSKVRVYDLEEVLHIEKRYSKVYSQVVRKKLYKSYLPLARELLSTQSENEFRAVLLQHELSKE